MYLINIQYLMEMRKKLFHKYTTSASVNCNILCGFRGDVNPTRYSVAFHPTRRVNRVTEQTVSGSFYAHHTSHTGTTVHSHSDLQMETTFECHLVILQNGQISNLPCLALLYLVTLLCNTNSYREPLYRYFNEL